MDQAYKKYLEDSPSLDDLYEIAQIIKEKKNQQISTQQSSKSSSVSPPKSKLQKVIKPDTQKDHSSCAFKDEILFR